MNFKKCYSTLIFLGSLLGLAACEDYSSAEGVLHTAGEALIQNDPSLFNRTLSNEALREFGNLDGMSRLQKLLLGSTPEIRNLKLLQTSSETRTADEIQTYGAEIIARGATVVDVQVQCLVRYPFGVDPLVARPISPTVYQSKSTCKISYIAPRQ